MKDIQDNLKVVLGSGRMRLQNGILYNMTLTWCNTNLHIFWLALYWPVSEENRLKSPFFQTHISTKPRKPRSPIMACTKYNTFWKNELSRFLKIHFTFIVTRGWRKLNSVAFQWNHKIYHSRHYQTPIFLRKQLQLPYQSFPPIKHEKRWLSHYFCNREILS